MNKQIIESIELGKRYGEWNIPYDQVVKFTEYS